MHLDLLRISLNELQINVIFYYYKKRIINHVSLDHSALRNEIKTVAFYRYAANIGRKEALDSIAKYK